MWTPKVGQSGDWSIAECGPYTQLLYKSSVWMSTTEKDLADCKDFEDQAKGIIFIAGLGLGMIPYTLDKKDEIQEIHVIELNQDVINLVRDQLLAVTTKVKIWPGDVFTFVPYQKYDSILIDIWPDKPVEEEVALLTSVYSKYTDHLFFWNP